MRRHIIRSPRFSFGNTYYAASAQEIYEMLGLGRKGKLPAEGMTPRLIDGISVRVVPLPRQVKGTRGRRMQHRVLGTCPVCKREMSVGRLNQHTHPVKET